MPPESESESESESKKSSVTRKRFTPPTVDEVAEYCKERNNGINPEHFIDYYTARDWTLSNGRKVADWKACIRTWESRGQQAKPVKPVKVLPAQDFAQRDYTDVDKELMEKLAEEMKAFTAGAV